MAEAQSKPTIDPELGCPRDFRVSSKVHTYCAICGARDDRPCKREGEVYKSDNFIPGPDNNRPRSEPVGGAALPDTNELALFIKEQSNYWCQNYGDKKEPTLAQFLSRAITDRLAKSSAPSINVELVEALTKIERWEMPVTGDKWPDGSPVSYSTNFGSNGERDYIRSIARTAISRAQFTIQQPTEPTTD